MNDRIIKIGLESGMLNYVDNETPRHYFLCGNADEQDLEKFAELIVQDCIEQVERNYVGAIGTYAGVHNSAILKCKKSIQERFGVEP